MNEETIRGTINNPRMFLCPHIGNALLCTKQFVGQDGNLGSTSVYHGCSECGLRSDV